jgi:galactokinase/mevalonate kinase-like predicted kinase
VAFYWHEPGAVVGTVIDKYIYIFGFEPQGSKIIYVEEGGY